MKGEGYVRGRVKSVLVEGVGYVIGGYGLCLKKVKAVLVEGWAVLEECEDCVKDGAGNVKGVYRLC